MTRGRIAWARKFIGPACAEPAIRRAVSVTEGNQGSLQARSQTGGDPTLLIEAIDPSGAPGRFTPPAGGCAVGTTSSRNRRPTAAHRAPMWGFSTELMGFGQDATGVNAPVNNRGTGEHPRRPRGLPDRRGGPRSPVREALRIPGTGNDELFRDVSVNFRSGRLSEVLGADRRPGRRTRPGCRDRRQGSLARRRTGRGADLLDTYGRAAPGGPGHGEQPGQRGGHPLWGYCYPHGAVTGGDAGRPVIPEGAPRAYARTGCGVAVGRRAGADPQGTLLGVMSEVLRARVRAVGGLPESPAGPAPCPAAVAPE